MTSFGRRLQAERGRLGLSQEDFAGIGGVKRTSQHLYEKDVRSPDAQYLAKIFEAGADVGYLITGQPTDGALSGPVVVVSQALAAFRAVDEFARKHGDEVSLQERERLFEFFCSSMSGDALVSSALLDATLGRKPR